MALENITTCPICDKQNFKPYGIAKDFTISKEEFELKECTNCHFIITNPRPDKASIGKYYASENYISHSGQSKTIFDKIYLQARNLTLNWKYELIHEYFNKPADILDYGCGTGEFLNRIKAEEWKIRGVEPATTARLKANQLLDNKVIADLESLQTQSFQVITLWHVLEHIHDLNETIKKLKALLTNDGIIVIAVPNPNSYDSQYYKLKWAALDVPRHLWHFRQKNINSLLKKNGLKVDQIKPMKLDSYYVSLLSEAHKNPNQSKIITALKAFRSGSLSNIYAKKTSEYSSLIYIAKKE